MAEATCPHPNAEVFVCVYFVTIDQIASTTSRSFNNPVPSSSLRSIHAVVRVLEHDQQAGSPDFLSIYSGVQS